MLYRTLPGTELQLPAIGLGCWAIGGEQWGDDVDDASSIALIRGAKERGVDLFDTAPLYGRGHADAILREALGAARHEVMIATKVGVRWDTPDGHPRSDLSPAHVVADCEASLRRLGLDAIPLLQTHWPCDGGTPLAATLEALEGLRRAGKVRAYGLSNASPAELDVALALAPIASLQTPYSMIRRDFEAALRGRCGAVAADGRWQQRVGVLAYEVLGRGLLTGKFAAAPAFGESDMRRHDPRFREPAWSRLQPLCEALRICAARVQVPAAALAIAWVLRQPGVSVALVGAKRLSQLDEGLRALEAIGRTRVFEALAPFIARARP